MEWVDKNVRPVFMPYIIDGIYECVQHMPRGSELIFYGNNLNKAITWLVKIAFLQKSKLSYFFRSSLTRGGVRLGHGARGSGRQLSAPSVHTLF